MRAKYREEEGPHGAETGEDAPTTPFEPYAPPWPAVSPPSSLAAATRQGGCGLWRSCASRSRSDIASSFGVGEDQAAPWLAADRAGSLGQHGKVDLGRSGEVS